MSTNQINGAGVGSRGLFGSGRVGASGQTRAADEVQQAVTAHRTDRAVDADIAPMMPALLQRLDRLEVPTPARMAPPRAPDPAQPPGPEQILRATGTASAKIRAGLATQQEPAAQRALRDMLDVLDTHLHMKHELLSRAADPGS